MVEKTKRALAILQRRGCSSPAAAAPPPGIVAAQNGTSNNGSSNGSNPSSTNGAQVESSTGDRDGNLKRLSGEIVAQTIRATEDRVAEVKRRAGWCPDYVSLIFSMGSFKLGQNHSTIIIKRDDIDETEY